MKKLFKTFIFMMAATMFAACSDDTPTTDNGDNGDNGDNTGGNTTELVADFDFVVEEGGTGKVTFTNKSQNAKSYEWIFGDANESVSVEENPTFTYQAAGTYKVSLTAINGEDYKTVEKDVTIVMEEKPEISFDLHDKNYDDWANIPSFKDNVTLSGGFKDIKIATTADKVFIYLEADNTFSGLAAGGKKFRVYFDIDNKAETGIQAAKAKGADIFDGDEGIHYWSLRPDGNIGTTFVDGQKMIDADWNFDNSDKVYFEGVFNLNPARTIITTNPVFGKDEYKDDPQFARDYSENEIKIFIEMRNSKWESVGSISAKDGVSPFSGVKLNQYVEKVAE